MMKKKIRQIIRKYAEFEGHTVTEAADGMEAVMLCRQNPDLYSIIIMDVMMPELDGFSAVKEIRKIAIHLLLCCRHAVKNMIKFMDLNWELMTM